MGNIYSVYHACREKDKRNYKEGYIGVSGDVEQRIRCHRTPKGTRGKKFMEAKFLYNDIIFYVIHTGSKKSCYLLEKELRPNINMGWNMFTGGGKGSKGYSTKWSESAKKKVSGINSHLWKGIYFTPMGIFYSCKEAGKYYSVSRSTIYQRCVVGGIIGRSKWQGEDMWGKTWRELGWYFIEGVEDE